MIWTTSNSSKNKHGAKKNKNKKKYIFSYSESLVYLLPRYSLEESEVLHSPTRDGSFNKLPAPFIILSQLSPPLLLPPLPTLPPPPPPPSHYVHFDTLDIICFGYLKNKFHTCTCTHTHTHTHTRIRTHTHSHARSHTRTHTNTRPIYIYKHHTKTPVANLSVTRS